MNAEWVCFCYRDNDMLRVRSISTATEFFIPHTYVSKVHNRSVMFNPFLKNIIYSQKEIDILDFLFLWETRA